MGERVALYIFKVGFINTALFNLQCIDIHRFAFVPFCDTEIVSHERVYTELFGSLSILGCTPLVMVPCLASVSSSTILVQ